MNHTEQQATTGGFFRQKLLTPFAAVVLAVVCVAGTATACLWKSTPTPTLDALYHAAVIDSVTVENDELFPLVTLTPESEMTTWKDGKILLMSINNKPDRYITGSTLSLPSAVWTFTDKELLAWYQENNKGVTDWPMRLKQLIGVPPEKEYTHITSMWVSPENVRRPAYNTDITNSDMPVLLPENTDDAYLSWFNSNIIWSYFDSAYPWTRLGYTYDWAADCDEYGLTEFLIHQDSEVLVESTVTIDEFIQNLEQKAA